MSHSRKKAVKSGMGNVPPERVKRLGTTTRLHARDQWLKDNRAALEAYNEHVEKHGVFSDGLRSF